MSFTKSSRYLMVFLAFLGFANVYAMRVNLSVAIVSMVNHTAEEESEMHQQDLFWSHYKVKDIERAYCIRESLYPSQCVSKVN